MILPVSTVRQFCNEPRTPENEDFFERFDQFMRKVVAHRELVLLPVFGNDHFCLLSVSSSQVRYFEGLCKGSASCRAAAEQLCKAMGVTMPEDKHNVYKQVGAECAMFVVHCAEAELRELHDEHRALVGWPDSMRMRALRERVGAWCAGLERERSNGPKSGMMSWLRGCNVDERS